MDSAFNNLDAAGFLQIWQFFDADDNGYIEGKELDDFFRHMLKKLNPNVNACLCEKLGIKRSFCSPYHPQTNRLVERLNSTIQRAFIRRKNINVSRWSCSTIDHRHQQDTTSCGVLVCKDEVTEAKVQQLKRKFMSAYDVTADGRLQIQELANMILPEEENFLLLFRREAPLDSSVEFMKIWRKYDKDCSGYICAVELQNFLKDLLMKHKKTIPSSKLDEYTDIMMKMFDRNKDGQLDLNDLASILALQDNFLLQFRLDAGSQKERKRDFEKIFSYYDVNKTGALEGAEVDGFVKDMMELTRPSISGEDLDKLRVILLRHCDANNDGKIQKNELALCLGLKGKQ